MRPRSTIQFDHFPTTERTWIVERVEERIEAKVEGRIDEAPVCHDGASALRRHVMERYAASLRVYAQGSSFRWLDDADSLVNGFFVSRLSRPEYLAQWIASAMPLRRFLANGLLLFMREQHRARTRRVKRVGASIDAMFSRGADALAAPIDARAFAQFEREWAREVLGEACAQAQAVLESTGKSLAWRLFERHFLDGATYQEAARELGVRDESARPFARLAQAKVREALKSLLALEGVAESEMDCAVADIYRIVAT